MNAIFGVELYPETGCQSFVYEVDADPNGSRHIYAPEADEFERYPLTGPPHHWFCESIGF